MGLDKRFTQALVMMLPVLNGIKKKEHQVHREDQSRDSEGGFRRFMGISLSLLDRSSGYLEIIWDIWNFMLQNWHTAQGLWDTTRATSQETIVKRLMMASTRVHLPDIVTGEDISMRDKLWRKCGSNGILDCMELTQDEKEYVLRSLRDYPETLVTDVDIIQLCFDCGATTHATGFQEDFVKGTLPSLNESIHMQGIAGSIPCTHSETIHYEFFTDNGTEEALEDQAYYMPELGCRLFSPQAYLRSIGTNLDDPDRVYLTVYHNRDKMRLRSGNDVTIPLDLKSHLPILNVYSDIENESKRISGFRGSVTDEDNQNLTDHQKILLRWHYRLGHLVMQHVQCLERQGILGHHGEKWGSTKVQIPKSVSYTHLTLPTILLV